MKRTFASTAAGLLLVAMLISSFSISAYADHSWGGYHWARTSNPFTLLVIDSHTSSWDAALDTAISDWSASSVMNLVEEAGSDSNATRKQCKAVTGKVRSCNAAYGFNGWLGLATISITGGVHITRGTAKMNDSYFNSGGYTATNRQHVICQEVGHTFGLDHQDESGADLNTCMDYSNALDNPHPNNHDYQELELIYAHLDSSTTIAAMVAQSSQLGDDPDGPENWGRLVSQSANGRSSTYEHIFWDGSKRLTHVFWTEEAAERCRACDHRYDH